MASIDVTGRLSGIDRLTRRFELHAGDVDDATHDALEGLGSDAELIFAAHALRKSGRMARSITANVLSDQVVVTAEARDPQSGYDYVGVTRFGHRVARIYPKRAKALRTPWGPRASVKGFHPATDWRDDALPAVRKQTDAVAIRLSRRIEVLT